MKLKKTMGGRVDVIQECGGGVGPGVGQSNVIQEFNLL